MSTARGRGRGESGAVAIIVGLMLPVLLGFAGLALDLGHWYLTGNQEQKAADAAALAGAVYLPGDPATAISTAKDYAARNGYTADVDTVVTPARETNPVQLRVTIVHTVDNYFTALFGMPRTAISRTAVAEFQGPVPMGSPANTYGDEPLGAGERRWSTTYTSASNQPLFWANIAGPRSTKTNGDAFQGGICAGADGCAGSTNTDYSADGYFYSVTVPSAGKLAIEVFDPAFVNVDDHCNSNLAGATTARNSYVTDAATRYASGNTKFCTGDQLFTGSAGDGIPPTTTFVFRSPTNTPWDPMTAPVINTATCAPKQYPGYNIADLKTALTEPATGPNPNAPLQQVFRQWVRVCTFDAPVAGKYYVQVRTNVAIGNPTGAGSVTFPGGGHNRYSMRAALLDGAGSPSGAGVQIEATAAMGIYANAPSATTQFFLARVPTGSGGHTLILRFFDISDASGTGQLTILPPPGEGPVSGFTNCVASGPQTATLPTCTVTANSSFNGRWEEVQVPLPMNYSCRDLDPTGCWVRIRYSYGSGSTVQDTTTWTASLDGDPVRIVE
jgi:hypothetical protein